jgi:hypothetical protein
MSTSHQAKPNQHNIRTAKLATLTAAQNRELAHWLQVEGITYAAARAKLAKDFGISTSVSALCRFWQQHLTAACAPAPAPSTKTVATDVATAATTPAPAPATLDILLDITIQSAQPVRLVVRKSSALGIGNLPMGEPIGE